MNSIPGVAPLLDVEEDLSAFSEAAVAELNGVDVALPTRFIPGSETKQLLLHLRLLRGLPMHISGDRDDHTIPDHEHQYRVKFGCRGVPEDDSGDDVSDLE